MFHSMFHSMFARRSQPKVRLSARHNAADWVFLEQLLCTPHRPLFVFVIYETPSCTCSSAHARGQRKARSGASSHTCDLPWCEYDC